MAAYWVYSGDWDLLGYEAAVVTLDAAGMYVEVHTHTQTHTYCSANLPVPSKILAPADNLHTM